MKLLKGILITWGHVLVAASYRKMGRRHSLTPRVTVIIYYGW